MNIDYFDKNKIVFSMLNRKQDIVITPVNVEIQPTNMCTYNCSYCAYKNRRKNAAFLKKDIMNQLIEDIIRMNVKTVCISGGGEPTLYPYLDDMIDKLYCNNIKTSLLTNGINQDVILRNADKFQYIVLHISSIDPIKYHELTGGYLANVIETANKIKERKIDTLIEAKIIVTDDTIDSLNDNIIGLKEKNFDRIICSPCYDYERIGEIAVNLDKVMKKIQDEKLDNENVHFCIKSCKNYASKCYMVYNRMHAMIFADGKVTICPSNKYLERGVIGDINDNRLYEIWNSDLHKEIVDKVNDFYIKKECKMCRFMDYNEIVDKIYAMGSNPHVYFL